MSKEIDNMLDNLLKEIDGQDGQGQEALKPASQEAVKRAEEIVTGVNQTYRRPPEPVKQSIPAPNLKKVVEPEPTSHFSDERSQDPAIRMHDRLDESSLPGLDAERRPTRIRDIDRKDKRAGSRSASGTRSLPTPPEPPKRKIPHIHVPDELPPDVTTEEPKPAPRQEIDPEREKLVKSRAEKIREQLRKHTLEETPIIPPPSEEEIDDMIDGIEYPNGHPKTQEEKNSIFSYLHQALGVEEGEDEPEEPLDFDDADEEDGDSRWFDDELDADTDSLFGDSDYEEEPEEEEPYEDSGDYEDAPEEEEAEETPRFRHLEEEEEIGERKENGVIAFFRGLFGKRTAEADEHELESGVLEEEDEDEDEDYASEDDYDSEESFGEEDAYASEVDYESDEEASEDKFEPVAEFADEPEEEPEELEELEEPDEPEDEPEIRTVSKKQEPAEEEPFEDEPEEEYARDKKPRHHFFKAAFDESAEELAEMKSEPEPKPEQDDDIKTRFLGRNSYFVAGIIVLLLAVVGLVTFISGIVRAAGGFFSGGSVKEQLKQVLYPVAVVDVPSFNEPAELTAEGALSAAIVDILMHDDLSGYAETFDMISVPAEDVLERGRQMFGVDVQTQLDTLHAAGESFAYDAQSNCFNVPVEPMIFSYSPEILKIQRNGDTYEVTVAYHGDVAAWQENSRNFRTGVTKNMQATIEKKPSGYRIVRLVPAQ